MAALLEKNGATAKPLVDPGLLIKESLSCPHSDCDVSYTLAYNDSELYMAGNERNIDRLRRTAIEEVGRDHASHSVETYVWKGAEKGWVDGKIAD